MTTEQEIEFALREADRMAILASEYRQFGFKSLAAEMTDRVKAARRFTPNPDPKNKQAGTPRRRTGR